MPLTDRSDLFASLHEEGINRVVRHIMRQRPSLFNYATAAFEDKTNLQLLCAPIRADKSVMTAGNPLFTTMPLLPVLGASYPIGLDWCFQLGKLEVDLHPGNVIALPTELGTLAEQHFALMAQACFGINCPAGDSMKEILRVVELYTDTVVTGPNDDRKSHRLPEPKGTLPLPIGKINCFCMKLYITGHMEWGPMGPGSGSFLKTRVDGIEIVDIGPDPLESMIECYLRNVLRFGILPRISIPLEAMVLDVTKVVRGLGINIGEQVELRPASGAAIPNNPSIEKDEVRAFIELSITP